MRHNAMAIISTTTRRLPTLWRTSQHHSITTGRTVAATGHHHDVLHGWSQPPPPPPVVPLLSRSTPFHNYNHHHTATSRSYHHPPRVVVAPLWNTPSQYRTFFSFGGGGKKDQPPPSLDAVTPTTIVSTKDDDLGNTIPNDDGDDNTNNNEHLHHGDVNTTPSVDDTLNQLFAEQQQQSSSLSGSSDAWYATAEQAAAAAAVWEPTWYNVADNAILTINYVQHTANVPYGTAIVMTTVLLRMALFPLMVQAQRAASRMAYVQPELTLLKDRYERISSPSRADQMQFSTSMKALFTKYKVNPFQTMVAPIVQIPLFIGMFFGLKKVSMYFPEELKVGGMLWFVDLSVPDPHYILPLMSSATFLLLVELGKDQMLRAGGSSVMMLNMFRFMCIMSLPFVVNFEASMLVYWVVNNLLTCAQTATLKAPTVRKRFGILEPPRPAAGGDPVSKDGLVASVTTLVKRAQGKPITEAEVIVKHNQAVEARQVSTRLTRAAREREQRRRRGITGTRNF